MGNKNNLVPYENLFPTQKGMILLMDEIRKELHLTLEDVKTSFLSSIARMAPRLPFSYFSPQMMASMLLERLRGGILTAPATLRTATCRTRLPNPITTCPTAGARPGRLCGGRRQ